MNGLLKKSLAEFMGTAILVFFACGTALLSVSMSDGRLIVDVVATALAFGLVFIAMVYSIGKISGCHINPTVSLAMLISKKMSVTEFTAYIAAQFLGAIAGAAALFGILKGVMPGFVGGATNSVVNTTAGGYISSIALEIILTFVFVYTILSVTSKKSSENGGFIIGTTLTLVHLVGINVTGTSVNPARSLGPALMRWVFGGGALALGQFWVFLIAPLAGGALAALVYRAFNKNKKEKQTIADDPFKEENKTKN